MKLFNGIYIISVYTALVTPLVSSLSLIVTNNGPATLGANISFTAVLKDYVPKDELTFIFNDGIKKLELPMSNLSVTISTDFLTDLYEEGFYFMNVTVQTSVLGFWEETVAVNSSKFELKRELIGEIFAYQNERDDVDEAAVGENVTIKISLYDPNNYLQNAAIDYSWSIDMERHRTLNSTLIYNFTDPGVKQIESVVTAVFPNNDFKFGSFGKIITAKVPVNNVNISGNPFLHHGETLNLNISCNGTPPFVYCYEVLKKNSSGENFSCTHLSSFTTCHMEIIKYFQDYGTYHVGIYISNNVKEVKRIMEIMVYNVSIKPTLSTVIIPIVCSLLTLVIIAVGISYCIQQRNLLAVEVANFDFQDESDSYSERTFFEQIYDSFTCRSCTRNRLPCEDRRESDPLI